MKWMTGMVSLLAVAAWPGSGADLIFDNGHSTPGIQGQFVNDVTVQRVYENFALTSDTIISGFSWQQHDDPGTLYIATRLSIYSGLPEVSSPLFLSDLVAARTPNSTGTIFGNYEGFDYSIGNLSLSLPAGTYWFGLNTIDNGRRGRSGWDATLGGPDTIPGARVVNQNFPAPGSATDSLGYRIPDFAFQVFAVPEPSTSSLLLGGALGLVLLRRCSRK